MMTPIKNEPEMLESDRVTDPTATSRGRGKGKSQGRWEAHETLALTRGLREYDSSTVPRQ